MQEGTYMARAKKLSSGKWRVLQFVGMDGNKRQYKSFTAPTKKEAEYMATAYVMDNHRKQTPSKLTVGEAIDRYIDNKTAVLSPSTIREYRQMRRNCLSGMMSVSLGDLTMDTIQSAINEDAKTKSPKTVRNAHGLLSSALKESMPDFVLRTRLPGRVKPSIAIPDKDNIQQLISLAKGTDMESVIMIASALGLRRSEISALTWADVDVTKRLLHVNKAIVLDEHRKWVVKPPKTFTSSRVIDMPKYLADHLQALKTSRESVTDETNVVALTPNNISDRFTKMRKQCNVDCRFHDLRHYNASVMLALGVPDLYAMRRLGHATPNMLKTVYQHTMRDKQKEVADAINAYMDETHKK